MSLKKEFGKSVIANWAGTLCAAVLAFFLTPIIVHSFGNARYGIWSIAMSMTSYYGILDIGIRTTIIRYFSHYHEKQDHEANNRLVNTMFCTYFIIVPIVLVVVLVLEGQVDRIFNIEPELVHETRILIVIIGINFCLNAFANTFKAMIFGLRMFTFQNTIQVTFSILRSVSIIVFLKLGFGIVTVALVVVALDQFLNLIYLFVAKKSYPQLVLSHQFVRFREMKEHYVFAFFNFVRHMSVRILERADLFLVGILFDMESVAMYAIAENLMRYVSKIPKGMTSVLLPFSSKLNAKEDRESLARMVLVIPKYTLSFLFMVFLLSALYAKSFIQWWMGSGYDFSFTILMILMLPKMLSDSQTMLSQIIIGMGYNRFYGILSFAEMVTNVILAIVFSRFFGVAGIAMGKLVTMTVTMGILVPIYGLKLLNIRLSRYYFDTMIKPFVPCVVVYFLYKSLLGWDHFLWAPIPAMMYLLISYGLVYKEIRIRNWKLKIAV